MKQTTEYFECACNSLKHLIKIEHCEDDNEIILSFCLNNTQNFFERLKTAFRFIFYPQDVSKFGNYDCVILNNKNDCERIVKLLQRVR